MGLVDYYNSDLSEDEQQNLESMSTATSTNTKKAFQKVVDKKNPGKIRVSLPQSSTTEEQERNGPPSKKVKIERISRGFNSLLPAPKRSISTTTVSTKATNTSKGVPESGVNLRTGETSGLNQELLEESISETNKNTIDVNLNGCSGHTVPQKKNTDDEEFVKKGLIFKPLSVSNKSSGKKKITSGSLSSTSKPTSDSSIPKINAERQPKVSLFPLNTEIEERSTVLVKGNYQPMLYNTSYTANQASSDINLDASHQDYISIPKSSPSNALSSIADSLDLSDSERRQLFGRQDRKGGLSTAASIINFNTDIEYQHNEEIRATGEQVTLNPVRAIAPGKHSLKQLIHAAQSQKDALEESFAKGKSNRAEASSRYGW